MADSLNEGYPNSSEADAAIAELRQSIADALRLLLCEDCAYSYRFDVMVDDMEALAIRYAHSSPLAGP